VEFGRDAISLAGILSQSETLAKAGDLLMTCAAPANFWPAAGCGHDLLLNLSLKNSGTQAETSRLIH
jgi:hypothetical protein